MSDGCWGTTRTRDPVSRHPAAAGRPRRRTGASPASSTSATGSPRGRHTPGTGSGRCTGSTSPTSSPAGSPTTRRPGSAAAPRWCWRSARGPASRPPRRPPRRPDADHLAVEVFEPGLAQLLMRIDEAGLANLRRAPRRRRRPASRARAARLPGRDTHLLPRPVAQAAAPQAPARAAGVRRARRLPPRPGGVLHLATDWAHYAVQMRAACAGEPLLENASAADDGWTPRPDGRPETKFERRARMEGRDVRDLVFRRISSPTSFTH